MRIDFQITFWYSVIEIETVFPKKISIIIMETAWLIVIDKTKLICHPVGCRKMYKILIHISTPTDIEKLSIQIFILCIIHICV